MPILARIPILFGEDVSTIQQRTDVDRKLRLLTVFFVVAVVAAVAVLTIFFTVSPTTLVLKPSSDVATLKTLFEAGFDVRCQCNQSLVSVFDLALSVQETSSPNPVEPEPSAACTSIVTELFQRGGSLTPNPNGPGVQFGGGSLFGNFIDQVLNSAITVSCLLPLKETMPNAFFSQLGEETLLSDVLLSPAVLRLQTQLKMESIVQQVNAAARAAAVGPVSAAVLQDQASSTYPVVLPQTCEWGMSNANTAGVGPPLPLELVDTSFTPQKVLASVDFTSSGVSSYHLYTGGQSIQGASSCSTQAFLASLNIVAVIQEVIHKFGGNDAFASCCLPLWQALNTSYVSSPQGSSGFLSSFTPTIEVFNAALAQGAQLRIAKSLNFSTPSLFDDYVTKGCQPHSCSYTVTGTRDVREVLIAALGALGGVTTALKIVFTGFAWLIKRGAKPPPTTLVSNSESELRQI